ncbi:MAG: hypothetical protein ACO3EY_03790 [Candidatus Nanopelagicales bacterium]
MATGQQIGEYFENSFAFYLSKLYGVSSQINLQNESQRLGLTPQEKTSKDTEASDTAKKVKVKLSTYYGTDSPSKIDLIGANPKRRNFFSGLYNEFDDGNPSDILLEYSGKTFPEEKYFGISLKSTSRGKATVKANLGVEDILKLFGKNGTTPNWASTLLYKELAESIVKARKVDVETNFSNYGLSSKPINHFSSSSTSKWFNKNFVRTLKNGKNLFENDAKQIKENYINYFVQELNKVSQDKLKRFIIETALKENSLPLYLVAKSTGGIFASYSTDKILGIISSSIVINTRKTPTGESRIQLKKNGNPNSIIEIRIKFASGQDMTSSIKVEIT